MSLSINSLGGGINSWNAGNVQSKLQEMNTLKRSLMLDNASGNKEVALPEYLKHGTGMSLGKSTESAGTKFSNLVQEGIMHIDGKMKHGEHEVRKVMAGEMDNLHQSVLAMQESDIAFKLLVETRNKAMEAYQELTRMNV